MRAHTEDMRNVIIVAGAAVLAGAVGVLVYRRLTAQDRADSPGSTQQGLDPVALTSAGHGPVAVGIADVDPQPLTQIAGEGVDLDTAPGADQLAPRVGLEH